MSEESPTAPSPLIIASPTVPDKGITASWALWQRFLLLNAGLLVSGFGLAAMYRARIGLAPWEALHQGIANHVPHLTVGQANIGVGLVLIAIATLVFKMPLGIGSVMNMVLLGLYMDFFSPKIAVPVHPVLAWGQYLLGILLCGLATGTYIASHFGAGPRDGLTLGLTRRTGWPVRKARIALEMAALTGGWLLGAQIGWGTLAFALLFGPAMNLGLSLYGIKR